MLSEMRKVTRGWIAIGVVGLLALAFAIWGINDVFRPIRSNDVATARGFAIGQNEFLLAFDNGLKTAEQQVQRRITKQDAVEANLHMQIVDELVTQRAFDRLADAVGVNASDAMVRERIVNNPAFRSQVTGAFDAASYENLLRANGMTRSLYEAEERGGLIRAQLAQALTAGLRPPSSFGRAIVTFETESRTATISAITADRVPAPPMPTEADLETFYRAQSQAFALPEYRTLTIIRADPKAFEARVTVPEDKIRELFEFRKAQLTTPERRSFSVVSGGDKAKAEDAARRLAAGEPADSVARALGMQALTFDQKTEADAPDPRIGAAVFALRAAGETTAAIQGVSWSAARVTAITPGVTPTVEQARPQLVAELARDEALTMMNDAVEKFEDARSGGADLEEAAVQAGLAVSKAGPVDGRGSAQNGQPDAALAAQADLLKAAFETAQGDASDWISSADGVSTLVRVDAVTPGGPPPLASIRDRVAAAWRAEKLAEGMAALAERIAAAVRGGKAFGDVVRAERLPAPTVQTITRRTAQRTPSPQLAAALFAARQGEVVTGAGGPQGQVLFIARLDRIERPDPAADPAMLEAARQSIGQALVSDTLQTVQNAARADARVRLHQDTIDRLVGKSNETEGDS